MANVTFKLTDIQKQAAAQLYRLNHLVGVNMNTVKALIAKGVIQKTNGKAAINLYELAFTFEAEEWADVMFGNPEPDPSDDSELDLSPMTAYDAMLATETVLSEVWADASEPEAQDTTSGTPCDLCGKPNGTPREYKSHVVMIACEDCMPSADTVDPQPASVQWRTLDDLPMHDFPNVLMRATFRRWILGYNAPQSRHSKPSRDLQANKVLPYMQRRNRQYTGKMRKQAHREWLAKQSGKKVLEIVSHIETPLTGEVRRIA